MRVIAGLARSIPLKAPEGMDTRPTTDRIKETLFNIIQFELPGAVFIDVFAGSGAIGIEAISRGAERAVFVDSSKEAADIIRYNISKCRFEAKSRLIKADASNTAMYIPKKADGQRLIIFMDPPYNKGLEFPVLQGLRASDAVDTDTLIILEEALGFDENSLCDTGFEVTRIKKYKNQKHLFLRKKSG